MLLCPKCEEFSLSLCDNLMQKQGFSSSLIIKCSQCNIISEFNTSKRAGRGFDVNKRLVYTMRVLGHGHSGLEKFAHLMNMPKPMTQNNYDKCIKSTLCAVEEVDEDTMADAAAEIRGSSDGVIDTCIKRTPKGMQNGKMHIYVNLTMKVRQEAWKPKEQSEFSIVPSQSTN